VRSDTRTGLPPTIEGGTPAPQGNLRLRYAPAGGRLGSSRTSTLRAARRDSPALTLRTDGLGRCAPRTSIQNFFRRGATVRGLVASGPDATFGTADDTLIATGETLAQLQTRVLGTAASAPLFPYIPGFATFGLRGGFRLGESHEGRLRSRESE
jgi:hemoglobin/transferrin/lactoferrin receptor protein